MDWMSSITRDNNSSGAQRCKRGQRLQQSIRTCHNPRHLPDLNARARHELPNAKFVTNFDRKNSQLRSVTDDASAAMSSGTGRERERYRIALTESLTAKRIADDGQAEENGVE